MGSDALDRCLIIIPCLNEERHLPGLLGQLLAESDGATIVVADGGSQDASRKIVSDLAKDHANLYLLDNPARLQSAGVNLAARRFGADFDWLVRLDAHCRYPDNYAKGLLAAADRSGADCVVVPMLTEGSACFQRGVSAAQNSVLGAGGSPHRKVGLAGHFVDHGHHALMRLDLYCAVGGYDESFIANEDAELDLRLAKSGARHWLEPAMAIVYFPRRDPWALARQYFNYGAGRARTLMRHQAPIKPRQAAPLIIAPAVIAGFAGLLASPLFHPAALLALPALAWAAACLGYGTVIGVRTRGFCEVAAGPAAMIMHFAWSAGYWISSLAGPPLGEAPRPLAA
jgi:succinoglycan biosynthesis protein ExoA